MTLRQVSGGLQSIKHIDKKFTGFYLARHYQSVGDTMFFSRGVLLLAMFFTLVWSACSYAGEKPSTAIRGTWYSKNGSIAFKNNGTINFKGKKYYYAVSNGGLIQLTGKRRSNAIPYQLSGGKLTLTVDGRSTVYTRKRQGIK